MIYLILLLIFAVSVAAMIFIYRLYYGSEDYRKDLHSIEGWDEYFNALARLSQNGKGEEK